MVTACKQLKQRPHEDIRACAEDVGPQKSVSLRTAGFGHAVKQAYGLLQQQLEPSRHHLEFRDDKHADTRRRYQQDSGYRHGGDQSRIDVFPAEQADLIFLMQNRVPHGGLNGLRFSRRRRQETAREQDRDEQDP